MEKNLTQELNEWWYKFDLIEKILIKDFLASLRGDDEVKKQKLLEALVKIMDKKGGEKSNGFKD